MVFYCVLSQHGGHIGLGAHGLSDRGLWAAVLFRAVLDATMRPRKVSGVILRNEARTWLRVDESDFERVCYWAGFDSLRVRKDINDLASRGWKRPLLKGFGIDNS